MSKQERDKDIATLGVVLAAEAGPPNQPRQIGADVAKLSQYARRIQTLNEADANQGLSAYQEARRRGIVWHATEIAERYSCGLYVNGDPRGAALILKLPSGATNDFGQRGWVVPE